jgi:hypothetical protein
VDYFSNFLQLKPYGTINKCIIRELSPDVAINSGIYTFKLTRDSGVQSLLWWQFLGLRGREGVEAGQPAGKDLCWV